MKTRRVKTFKSANLKSNTGRHKLTNTVKKYIDGIVNRWFSVFDNTSLHGFRYISMVGSTIFEAVFWLVICISSIIFCVILMGRIWNNYSNHPITTSISTSDPVTDLFFPSVLICNNNKIYRPQAEIIAKLLHENGFTEEESEKFFYSLPKLIISDKISLDNVTALRILNTLNMSVDTLMEKLMQPCSALLVRCGWVGRLYDCNKIFKMIKSKEGFCCAFNFHYNFSFDFDKLYDTHNDFIDSDDVRSRYLPGVATIVSVPGSGRDVGLTVAVNVERDTYKATTRPFVGATVMVHDPIDYPTVSTHVALPNHLLVVSVFCTAIHGAESLWSLPVKKRMCYLNDEMNTKVLNEVRYNYESCLTSCIGQYIIRKCNCLPFFFPKIHGAKTCYLDDVECILKLEKCNDFLFRTSSESIQLDKSVNFEYSLLHGLNLSNMSIIQVFFDDMFYIHYHKDSTISWDALLASFGGIFGLCLGGSVISVIELIYLLIRKFFRRQSLKKREKFPKSLPPASEIFLSIPVKEMQTRSQKSNDERDSVTWYQSTFHQHKARNTYTYYKHKF
ncbi:pickpocket protein 28-like [Pseudomyrmex gracilis]|uniref:pickpocket protein 28-like n=1 Tax=Pseudomyrmex gracilis TaxID=219809 RepID=UPI000994ABB1|nr:pickpocket protein 28-like [Pseudomyrmex gracilis]